MENEDDVVSEEFSGMTTDGSVGEEPVVAHFDPGPQGLGLDGSTPFEGGIEGRLTHAGSDRESPRNERDWVVHVDVDQPVQTIDD